ncbi:PaREP1 family protein [Caldivirga sp.]|uniref:PaREP1 family protein n=1 Tax=Caldivirga sp. TaxID=2080243 RepID=UPI00345BDF61
MNAHLEFNERFLNKSKELINKDPVKENEKLYKVAEETVKAMAIAPDLNEAKAAIKDGKWTTTLLLNAVDSISD